MTSVPSMQVPLLYAFVDAICVLFMLLIYGKSQANTAVNRFFRRALLVNCLLFVSDALWSLADSTLTAWDPDVCLVIYALYFLTSGLACLMWFLYVEMILKRKLCARKILLSILPVLVLTVLVLLSFATGWIYGVDAAGRFVKGPLYWLSALFTYGYILLAALVLLKRRAATKNYAVRKECLTLSTYSLPVFIAGVLQEIFFDLPILCVGITFALFYVLFSLLEQQIMADAMTGLSNYNCFMKTLAERMSHVEGRTTLYLLMMDLDHFKALNDRYGHLEGDEALKTVARVLKDSCQDRHHFAARFGGDEFVALCDLAEGEEITGFIREIREGISKAFAEAPYHPTISIGSALYHEGDVTSEEELVKEADEALYRDKARRAN